MTHPQSADRHLAPQEKAEGVQEESAVDCSQHQPSGAFRASSGLRNRVPLERAQRPRLPEVTDSAPSQQSRGSTPAQAIQLANFDNGSFDRGASRLKESLWLLARTLLFLLPLPLPSSLRAQILRLFGAEVGRGVVIRSRVNITFPWRLSIGDHCWIGEEVILHNLAPINIGHDVCLSQRAFLCTGSHDFRSKHFDLITGPITVSAHSWIAANVFVGPSVNLGRQSMVTAGSVVTRSQPEACIISGQPARAKEQLVLAT